MEKKKEIKITLEVKELIYDVQQVTHKTGQAREADGKKGYEAASLMQASEDEEESYQVRRSIANYYAQLRSALGEYLDDDKTSGNNLVDQPIDEDARLEMVFQMPSNYNNSGVDSMGKNAHGYIVNMTISEWFLITNPEEAPAYATLAGASLEALKRAFYRRERPERPVYKE